MNYQLTTKDSINHYLSICQEGDTIYLAAGIYNEKIEIYQNNICIIGEERDKVIIQNHDFFHKIMDDYNECNTFRSYTVFVGGDDITISNCTIENTSVPSSKYGQAVALHVNGNNFTCSNCSIVSAQDTLFTGPLPPDLIKRHQDFLDPRQLSSKPSCQAYQNCIIKGDVDFIFGTATAFFNECEIISIEKDTNGYISAPAHNYETPFGYLFYHCNMISNSKLNNVFLARPWRDFGKAAFIECNYGDHISPLGFNKWNETNRDKTASFYEFNPKCNISKRVAWSHQMQKKEADDYIKEYFSFFELLKKETKK